MAGNGDIVKGAVALKGVSIPMFNAKGMRMERSNGEIVTPYYFAYEDLLEDWTKMADSTDSANTLSSTKPKVFPIHCTLSHSQSFSIHIIFAL